MKIVYINRGSIDTKKWDSCIARSVNSSVYAYSWYLDIVAPQWGALVANDYSTVFPLPFSTKYGITYVYQPGFTQYLGIFSRDQISDEVVSSFFAAIPPQFQHVSIYLNPFIKAVKGSVTSSRTTFNLDLIQPFHATLLRFSETVKKNVLKATALNVSVLKGLSISQLFELIEADPQQRLSKDHLNTLKRIISFSTNLGVGQLYGAYTNSNQLCAAALFLTNQGRSTCLFSTVTPEGIENKAMYFLIDSYIIAHSEKNLVLDFEGASNTVIAEFYKGFGAIECTFNHVVLNRLPWYLKLFR